VLLINLGVRGSVDATSRKVASSSPDELIEFFFQFFPSLQPLYGPRVYSAQQKWEPQDISAGKTRPARKADNLTTICEPIV
jgi:hypothetical protein